MRRGDFDIAAVGRAILSDPEWARKVHTGRIADILPFTAANLDSYR